MIKRGIRKIGIKFLSLCNVWVHTPGIFATKSSEKKFRNEFKKKVYYAVEPQFYEMLDDGGESCNKISGYNKDNCVLGALEKIVNETFGCTTPFWINKDNICVNKTVGKKVYDTYKDWLYNKEVLGKSHCSNPCKVIIPKATKTEEKIKDYSALKFVFPDRVTVVKSYYIYSGLSMIAEIGGYFGLFLGVSFNQITQLTSRLFEWMNNKF